MRARSKLDEDNRPDRFWPWDSLNIDEREWEAERAWDPDPPRHVWWFVAGGIIGLLLVLVSGC